MPLNNLDKRMLLFVQYTTYNIHIVFVIWLFQDPTQLDQRVEAFFMMYERELRDMTEFEFQVWFIVAFHSVSSLHICIRSK